MALKLSYNVGAEVRGGPKLAVTADLDIQGYSVFQIDMEAQSTRQVDLHLEPPESIQALLISCDQRDRQVSFSVPGGAIPAISLAVPQLLMGDGARLLGTPPPYLELRNDTATPVTVRILVGRTVDAGTSTATTTTATPMNPTTPGSSVAPAAPPAPAAPAAPEGGQKGGSKAAQSTPTSPPPDASATEAPVEQTAEPAPEDQAQGGTGSTPQGDPPS